jgi:D-aminopeptidase
VGNDEMDSLFEAVAEATEESVDNALFMATTVTGSGNRAEAIPLAEVKKLLDGAKP